MILSYRNAESFDMERCVEVRGMTNDNPMTINELDSIGVNSSNWCPLIESGAFLGKVCQLNNIVIGFCFGEVNSGEILVLAVLPEYEGMGIGAKLLGGVSKKLLQSGSDKLWLAASPDPIVRAYGFYRFLGWKDTGKLNEDGDQILALLSPLEIMSGDEY
ncbi:MAG: ribosomal protein S18 acetylase RimI-like enzyme [Alphaproteobacteria bacterium]|jgi:ribosomal protein S18 acetylase RimI-like enzyme